MPPPGLQIFLLVAVIGLAGPVVGWAVAAPLAVLLVAALFVDGRRARVRR